MLIGGRYKNLNHRNYTDQGFKDEKNSVGMNPLHHHDDLYVHSDKEIIQKVEKFLEKISFVKEGSISFSFNDQTNPPKHLTVSVKRSFSWLPSSKRAHIHTEQYFSCQKKTQPFKLGQSIISVTHLQILRHRIYCGKHRNTWMEK